MVPLLLTIAIVFGHPGSVAPLTDIAEHLQNQGVPCEVFSADELEKIDGTFDRVITDVGHPTIVELHQRLAAEFPHIRRIALYENPEPYVPGGYSEVAAQVIEAVQEVYFCNKNLSAPGKKVVGLGWSPLLKPLPVQGEKRSEFFKVHGLEDGGQKIALFLGTANAEESLSLFVKLAEAAQDALPNTLFVYQPHPRAKPVVLRTPVIASKLSYSDAIRSADIALYDQTSANLLLWAMMPTIQVRKEPYSDLLVKNGLCKSVSHVEEFILEMKKCMEKRDAIKLEDYFSIFGIDPNWRDNLLPQDPL